MKPIIFINILFLVVGCVSRSSYKTKFSELEQIKLANKTIRKEIRQYEKANEVLKDSILLLNEMKRSTSESMKLRLSKYNIHVKFDQQRFNALSHTRSVMDAADYKMMKEKYPSTDTHSAKSCSWLTADEKKMYYFLNYARLDPQGFCKKFVMPRLRNDSSNVYLLTLIDYLMEMRPLNAVKPDRVQYENARCHAESSGKLAYIGHNRQSKECKTAFRGECCAYGNSDPLAVVMQLLIDSSVPSLGHRYICLGWYEFAGISSAPHKSFGTNVVMDFR